MVLQNVLSYILNKYLGEFVENLDANQLNVGIWGGDVELKNLVLKPSALNELDLPVQAVYGTIGKLVLKIPWKNVYTSPSVISVEDIYLIVQPNQQVKYDPVKEEKNQYESKKQEIQRIEEAKKAVAEKGKPPTKLGWTQEMTNKLVATIIKNIQLKIKNIHIRYEDRVTNSRFPFAFGVTLSELVVESTDSNWEKTLADDIVKIYKVLQLDGLSVYFNSRSRMYADLPTVDVLYNLRKEIASKQFKPKNYTYVLGPINSSARLKINQQPESDTPPYSLPKVHLNLRMERLFVGISRTQYRDLIALADSMSRMARGARYRKYRPHLPAYRGHYIEWWHFAYRCLVEGDIRRRRRDWDWNHILEYRNMCRLYERLSMMQQQNKSLSTEEKEKIVECEKVLDITNILIIRHKIEMESERLMQSAPQKKGWFSWWKSSTQSEDEKAGEKILKQFKEDMTPEEKKKLYAAIGYQENAAPTIYPEEYVAMTGTFHLKTLQLELMDNDSHDGNKPVLLTDLKNVICKVETRPAASALKVSVKLDSFTTIGMKQDDFVPHMIVPESDTQKDLLEVNFESNPIDKRCDYRIHVVTQPIRVIYDERTINKIVDIFTIPPDTALEELSDAAADTISDVKEMTSLGLQYAIEKHAAIDLDVDVRAPYVIVPYGGRFEGSENVLVLNLGHLRVYTHGKRSSTAEVRRLYDEGKDLKDIFEIMMENSYDNFKLELTDLQVVVAQSDEDWYKAVRDSAASDMHILQPLTMSVTVSKCLITDDPRLPLTRVRAELPRIDVVVSEARLMLLIALAASIEPPGKGVPEPQPLSKAKGSSMMLLKYKELQESAKNTKHLIEGLANADAKETVQFITLEADFIMSEFSLTINQQESLESELKELAVFKLNSLKCQLRQQTYVTTVSLLLGSISLDLDRLGERIHVISTPASGKKEEQLFEVKFVQVDEKCPELHSTYKSCECSLLLDFRVLSVVLHQEGLLSLLKLSANIQDQLDQVGQDRDRVATTRQMSYLSVNESIRDDGPERKSRKKKIDPVVVSTIKFKLVAALKELNVKFATDATDISFCAIRGIDTTIIVKNSYTQINARLEEIAVIDLNEDSIHKLILSGTEGVALTSQIVLNNQTEGTGKPDIQVQINLGEARIVFLNWFVTNMLNFLNQFQDAQQKIIEASQVAARSARENMKVVYAKATKMSLDIRLKAPIVVVPVDSRRCDCLVLDMGVITLSNSFLTLDVRSSEGFAAVVDDLKIDLTELKVTRVVLDERGGVAAESALLEPLTFTLAVKRNLSTSWYKAIPDVDVFGKIGTIKLLLSKADYQTVMDILGGNLAEGRQDAGDVAVAASAQAPATAQSSTTVVDINTGEEVPRAAWQTKKEAHIFLKFAFSMDHFVIDMFTGGAVKLDSTSLNHDSANHLARFSLEGLSLKGRIMTDQSMVTSVLLLNCFVDDMRKGRGGKLRRLVGRSRSSDDLRELEGAAAPKEFAACRSMIDVTYQQTDKDTFIDCRVFSFTVILSVDYLMKVADFFNTGEQGAAAAAAPAARSVTNVPVRQSGLTQLSTVETPVAGQMTVNLKVEKPDIILVEHMDSIDTNAMILNAEILIKLRQAGTHQVLNGVIKDLQLYTCVYNPALRAETRGDVLHPVTISVAGSTPEDKGLHIELLVTDIHVRVSPATIELLNRVLVTMTSSGMTEDENKEVVFNYNELWQQKALSEKDYWFLRPEYGFDVLAEQFLVSSNHMLDVSKTVLQELCIISMPSIIVTVEIGMGIKTLPVLMLESGFKGSARNWSSQLGVSASLTLQMGYYNSKLALWEPLIEPEVVRNNTFHVPWELKIEVSMNQDDEDAQNAPSPASENEVELPQPLMSVDVSSEKSLELTVTKTFLECLAHLQKAFASAMDADAVRPTAQAAAPYRVLNEIGEDVTLLLERSSFEPADGGAAAADVNRAAAVPLQLRPEYAGAKAVRLDRAPVEAQLRVRVDDKKCELVLPVVRADRRFFPLHHRSSASDSWGVVCDIEVDDGITVITLRSILQVHNHFTIPVDVYYMTSRGDELELVGSVKPRGLLNVPLKAVYSPTGELFFAVAGHSVSRTPFVWKDLQTSLGATRKLHCSSSLPGRGAETFVVVAVGEMEQVYYENTVRHTVSSACYHVHVRPAVEFKNCLPLDVVCCVDEAAEEWTVKAGDTLQLPKVDPGRNVLVIRIVEYLDREWSCRKETVPDPEEFSVWTFHSYDSPTKMSLDLGVHILKGNGTLIMTLYCPFWMLNKTDMMLVYRTSDEATNVLHHPADFKGPILFSFNAKNFFGKKKASIKVATGEWSDKFSLDVAGSSGVINCKYEEHTYQIGVQNQLTSNGLTKQVIFTPYYVIINNAPFAIECQEYERPADPWVTVEPRSCAPLWPKSDKADKLMRLRVKGHQECTAPFLYTESHTTLLKLANKFGGINIDIQLTEGAVYINLAAYEVGSAPALLINHSTVNIDFWEKDSVQKRVLPAKHACLYTWDNPSGSRVLVWDRGGGKEHLNDLRRDSCGEFRPDDCHQQVCWASFLDGMQRVLLFTEERSLAEGAQASNLFEVIQQEVTVSVHGVGVSLVNNARRQEIMYIGIASTGVIWESKKPSGTRFKHLSPKESAAMEAAFQDHLRRTESDAALGVSSRAIIDAKTEVDFDAGVMLRPHRRSIRRTFLTGLWLQLKTSPSQMQLHAKVNRLQIDNQMYDCIFPVVLAPVPLPKSVSADSGMKPFVEVSIVKLLLKNSQIQQFKYFKVLVQEFHIKVDMGFINAIVDMLERSDDSVETERELFLGEMKIIEEELYSHVSSQSIQEQKSFYDLLHFSPFKIHISFSMAAGSSTGQNPSAPNFLNVLLQGLGVTLTDMQDVVFKLAFFQRDHTFLTQRQLIGEATSHYVGQAVKQLYVLVLGLDVLGNPYGLVVGITKGVEDLFYEPFQGAIQGPGEFAEGLALGVKSLFGHTVGGAAGAMSRITGAMGKGIAALTFDDDYQRKRREQLNKRPATAQEGIARSGKGLVMGVYSGVTGVFTKPVEGAKEQGVEGFFKGLGKGAVGLVTRPVAGVVDFASGSFDVVKRAAECNEETSRLRAPRFLQADNLVRPYNKIEAEGHKLLMELSKGKYAKTDIYVAHYTVIPRKEMLLLTDKRIAYLCHNDIFGGWQMEWSYTWEDIRAPPKVVPKGVSFTTSEKKKFFGSSEYSKTILIKDPSIKEEICVKIESLRNN